MFGFQRLRLQTPTHSYHNVMEFAVTNWLGRVFFRKGWGGLTLPLGVCALILYWDPGDEPGGYSDIRTHEWVHIAQSEKQSFWLLRWIWATITHGYADNPYEIEARQYASGVLPDWAQN